MGFLDGLFKKAAPLASAEEAQIAHDLGLLSPMVKEEVENAGNMAKQEMFANAGDPNLRYMGVKDAAESAETLAPMELPALSGSGGSRQERMRKALPDQSSEGGVINLGKDEFKTLPEGAAASANVPPLLAAPGAQAAPAGLSEANKNLLKTAGAGALAAGAMGAAAMNKPGAKQLPPSTIPTQFVGAPKAEIPAEEEDDEDDEDDGDSAKKAFIAAHGGVPKPKTFDLDFGGKSIGSDEALKAAQAARDNDLRKASFQKAAAELGRGLSGIGGSMAGEQATPVADQLLKGAENHVKDYNARVENEKDDPKSAISQSYRNLMAKMGVNVKGDFTATQGEKLLAPLTKMKEGEEARAARHEDMKYKYAALQADKDLKKETRKQELLDKEMDKYRTEMEKPETAKSGAIAHAAMQIRRGDALEALLSGKTNLTSIEEQELASAMDTYLRGTSAVGTVNKLVPKDFRGSGRDILSWVTSKPQGADRKELLGVMKNMLQSDRLAAEATIKEYQTRVAANHPNLLKSGMIDHDLNSRGLTEHVKAYREGKSPKLIHESLEKAKELRASMEKKPSVAAPTAAPVAPKVRNPQIEQYANMHNMSYERAEAIIQSRMKK